MAARNTSDALAILFGLFQKCETPLGCGITTARRGGAGEATIVVVVGVGAIAGVARAGAEHDATIVGDGTAGFDSSCSGCAASATIEWMAAPSPWQPILLLLLFTLPLPSLLVPPPSTVLARAVATLPDLRRVVRRA
jgi:hypothetical protein